MKFKWFEMLALIITVIGGINWGLIGIFGAVGNLVALVSFDMPMLENILYIIVGIASLYSIYLIFVKKK